jgi:non-homologous end joining protein Ku
MAPRASWKGYLKLSLVSCPITLYPAASTSERISFNRIKKPAVASAKARAGAGGTAKRKTGR